MPKRHTVAGDAVRSMELWRVWLRMGLRDARRRFRRSVLGASWIFLNLAITITAVGTIYGALLGQDYATFLPFLTIGLLTWGYLTASVTEGGQAFIASEGYVKQIGLPLYVYVLRFFVSISATTLIGFLAYPPVAMVAHVSVGWGTLWALPGLLLLAAVSLLLITTFAYLTTRFRDAGHMAAAGLQVMFYITPILWPRDALRGQYLAWVVDLNPLYHLIEIVRRPLLTAQPASGLNYVAAVLTAGGLLALARALATRYHRRIVYFL